MCRKFLNINNFLFFFHLLFFLSSCGSSKDIVYFQGVDSKYDSSKDFSKYEIRIDNNDNLLITVSSKNPLAAEVFNIVRLDRSYNAESLQLQGYLVDESGSVNIPLIGMVRLAGLTKSEAVERLQEKISEYIEDPVVNIRFMNYKVTVLGEVTRPGAFTLKDEKITIIESLGLAGDMTIYGNRHEVLVCRDVAGKKSFYKLDITSPEIFNSPVYYLQQNDVVYVQPNKARIRNSTNYTQNLSIGISAISLLITIAIFFRR